MAMAKEPAGRPKDNTACGPELKSDITRGDYFKGLAASTDIENREWTAG
jgi:hypothetical protein